MIPWRGGARAPASRPECSAITSSLWQSPVRHCYELSALPVTMGFREEGSGGVPKSRYKYLYERLGPEDFQLLVNAVMPHAFPGYRPLPLGQTDGGRDGVQTLTGDMVVFQVKWSGSGHEKDPVSWLNQVVRHEESNLKRLSREGVRRYVLVTNVGSTGAPTTGTFDRLTGSCKTTRRSTASKRCRAYGGSSSTRFSTQCRTR